MGKKNINLGFLFPSDTKWTGGVNYFISLVTSLSLIQSKNFKFIIIANLNNKSLLKFNKINKKNIIYTNFFNDNHILNLIRKVILFIFREDYVLNYFLNKYKINLFSHYKPLKKIKSLCWIPDLQHLYLKKNFNENERRRRDKLFSQYLENSHAIIVSSEDTKKKLFKNYKKAKNKKIKVLNFVPKINLNKLNYLNKKKYELKKSYLYIPNQFWPHKNHEILIKCARELKIKNYYIQFVMSGNNTIKKRYYDSLIIQIKKLKLNNYFYYVGMIPKDDVSKLIFNSKAVINPSLFEGWNTSVEESKILKKKIILSDIPVHREQALTNAIFFEKNNHKQLAKIIMGLKYKKNINLKKIKNDYEISRKNFAKNYFDIIQD